MTAFVDAQGRTCAAEPAELIAHCRARLAGYKYPRRVTILAQLPRGATGKVLKSRLPAT